MQIVNLWDVAAGMMIAFMVVAGLIYGLRNDEKFVAAVAAVAMAAIIIWRANCWYSGACVDAGPPPISAVSLTAHQ